MRFVALRQPTAEQAIVAREIEAEPGAAEIRDLQQAIAALTPDLVAIRNRIDRDTVNIGVIGRAKAGKSTLLRTITDLGEEAIPSTELNPTTAARSRILHSPRPGRRGDQPAYLGRIPRWLPGAAAQGRGVRRPCAADPGRIRRP